MAPWADQRLHLYNSFIPHPLRTRRSLTPIGIKQQARRRRPVRGRLVSGRGRGAVRPVRSLCPAVEARLMILDLLYIAATVGVAIYMLVALLGPETF